MVILKDQMFSIVLKTETTKSNNIFDISKQLAIYIKRLVLIPTSSTNIRS